MTLMTLRTAFSRVSFFILGIAVALAAGRSAWAGAVKGTVKLPDNARSTRLYQGYWRLENGNVPVQNTGGAKLETAVVLENVNGSHPPAARTVTVELGGLDARPRMVVVGPGSVIELKNTGKIRLELSTPDSPAVMPPEQLPPGATRRQKFDSVGGFAIRDAEYPHLMISVIVVDSPYYSTVDEKGSFAIAGVPDGKANLKVWTRGKWASEQEIDTGSKEDLVVKVTSEHDKEKEASE
jgi:hypothetical protein